MNYKYKYNSEQKMADKNILYVQFHLYKIVKQAKLDYS